MDLQQQETDGQLPADGSVEVGAGGMNDKKAQGNFWR